MTIYGLINIVRTLASLLLSFASLEGFLLRNLLKNAICSTVRQRFAAQDYAYLTKVIMFPTFFF